MNITHTQGNIPMIILSTIIINVISFNEFFFLEKCQQIPNDVFGFAINNFRLQFFRETRNEKNNVFNQ